MKLIADENIPFAKELFSSLAEVVLTPGREINAGDLHQADFLIVRSVTKVNKALLDQSNVQFIGTCTIGTDHIDTQLLVDRNITFASAPGCNANAVVQYVVCALSELDCLLLGKKVAVIGCGNVGHRVYQALSALGLRCVGVDPFLTSDSSLCIESFETIYDADIICMHTPLVSDGKHPTESLIDYSCLSRLKKNAVLLNAGRGECVNNRDLLQFCKDGGQLQLVLDVWANEPSIDSRLFPFVSLGTPHIAGYSFEGKIIGATMIFRSLAVHLNKDKHWIDEQVRAFHEKHFGKPSDLLDDHLSNILSKVYTVKDDHAALIQSENELPSAFDKLRKDYPMRREFSNYRVSSTYASLSKLGFLVG